MKIWLPVFLFVLGVNPVLALPTRAVLEAKIIVIPGGGGGIGIDDMVFSPQLHKLLLPAGHTGKLYLIDPANAAMTSIGGFSSSAVFQKGHDIGISSVDTDGQFIFVPDHGAHQLDVVNKIDGTIMAKAPLAGDPDFVRYVNQTRELWVTEPDNDKNKQIEVFALGAADASLTHVVDISFQNGPESLTIDQSKGLAYTNMGIQTAVIDVKTHQITSTWPNSCQKAHGTVLDEKDGYLFIACGEGKVVTLDTKNKGNQLASLTAGPGIDLIDYNPVLAHLYVPSSKTATLSIVGVQKDGSLSVLKTSLSVKRGHCVVADDQNDIWVCDPKDGQLLEYKDTLPAVK